jgi:hypothetical protein
MVLSRLLLNLSSWVVIEIRKSAWGGRTFRLRSCRSVVFWGCMNCVGKGVQLLFFTHNGYHLNIISPLSLPVQVVPI